MLQTGGAELRIGTGLAELGQLYAWLEAAADAAAVPPALRPGMHVVLEEVAANVAMHGVSAGQAGEITVRLRRDPAAAVLEIEDSGAAFDPTLAEERSRTGDILQDEPGGWGLRLIRRYCQDIAYERRDGRNRLTLRFPTEAAG